MPTPEGVGWGYKLSGKSNSANLVACLRLRSSRASSFQAAVASSATPARLLPARLSLTAESALMLTRSVVASAKVITVRPIDVIVLKLNM